MFTICAVVILALTTFAVEHYNRKDRATYDRLGDEEARRTLLLHIRQDVKLISFLLFAVLIMLRIIADRVH
jgi:hypothetical protein